MHPAGTSTEQVVVALSADRVLDPGNEAYRSRFPVAPGVQVDEAGATARATAALTALTDRAAEPTSREVAAALVAAGFASGSVQACTGNGLYDQPSAAHAIGIDLGGACLTGGVRDDVVELAVSGGCIAHGGCLALPGH